jgi:deoxyadenosine/deoxycytidine kinase
MVVTGSVAAGATTLAEILAVELAANTLLEKQIEETNPFFVRAQEDPSRWQFTSQVHFLLASTDRHARLNAMLDDGSAAAVVIEDRTPFEHTGAYVAAHAVAGTISAEEALLLAQLTHIVSERYIVPDLLVYREMTPAMVAARVQERSRAGEQSDSEWLTQLLAAFDRFVDSWDLSPVVRIPAEIDVREPGGRAEALRLVSAAWP